MSSEEKKCLCRFDGQLYFCLASKWSHQKGCGFGLESPHRRECVYYNSGVEGRCDNRKANKMAYDNHKP